MTAQGRIWQTQFWQQTKRPQVGQRAALRLPVVSAQMPNPPTLGQPVIAAAVAGQTSITLRADSAFGRLVPGDTVTVDAEVMVVAQEALSTPLDSVPQGFVNVMLAKPLANNHAAGAPAQLDYACDVPVYAVVTAFPRRLVDGVMILTQDLSAKIGVFDVRGHPLPDVQPFTQIRIDGDWRTIVSVMPDRAGTTIVSYTIQAR